MKMFKYLWTSLWTTIFPVEYKHIEGAHGKKYSVKNYGVKPDGTVHYNRRNRLGQFEQRPLTVRKFQPVDFANDSWYANCWTNSNGDGIFTARGHIEPFVPELKNGSKFRLSLHTKPVVDSMVCYARYSPCINSVVIRATPYISGGDGFLTFKPKNREFKKLKAMFKEVGKIYLKVEMLN